MLDVKSDWKEDVAAAYSKLDISYRSYIEKGGCIPDKTRIFNAFKTLPKKNMRYILFGQDPYPRTISATGHAFIDGAVTDLFSPTGLSKPVNKATSLRNFVKMALLAQGLLKADDLSQPAIAAINKDGLIKTIDELRANLEANGVLLLNTALVFENKRSSMKHVKAWKPFIRSLLCSIDDNVKLILFGAMAKEIEKIPEASRFHKFYLEHPYNTSFITNPKAHELFSPMFLLKKP